ncbi:YbaB/EbfC family nucleoid-associated protein [Desulfovibrio aminophilus]|nr:YbaB/EbfC family nucleoid-associated protein [Desulfovibrio aminophilus]MCM0754115.1 YbaB/EbfC family nucleoid-associated protein [Desulfovibrio aminophilus]
MKGMNEMLRQAQIMQKKLLATQEGLKAKVVEAASGGGMVTVQANGGQELVSVAIDPSVVASGDVEMLQDLVLAAANEALKKAKELMEQEMGQVTGGMRIPGLF